MNTPNRCFDQSPCHISLCKCSIAFQASVRVAKKGSPPERSFSNARQGIAQQCRERDDRMSGHPARAQPGSAIPRPARRAVRNPPRWQDTRGCTRHCLLERWHSNRSFLELRHSERASIRQGVTDKIQRSHCPASELAMPNLPRGGIGWRQSGVSHLHGLPWESSCGLCSAATAVLHG